jgi:hypothetical protein
MCQLIVEASMADEGLTATVAEMQGYIARKVASGFDSPSDVINSAVEVFCDDAELNILRSIAERLTREAVAVHFHNQASWPETTDCDRLDDAMTELTRGGIICRQNFSCCGNCGVAEISDELEAEREAGLDVRGYAFYHMQDTEAATEGCGVHLNYGSVVQGEDAALRIGQEIVAALQRHGLHSRWDGKWDTRIRIDLEWKRRLPQEAGGKGSGLGT